MKILSELPEEEILKIERIFVNISQDDIPEFPRHKEKCSVYGEHVVDYREVTKDGNVKCKNCAHGSYYNVVKA